MKRFSMLTDLARRRKILKEWREAGGEQTEKVRLQCTCGFLGHFEVLHYGEVRCPGCHLLYWAMRPKRSGKLFLFPRSEVRG